MKSPRTPLLPLLAGLCLALPSLSAPGILWEWRNKEAAVSILSNGLPRVATGDLLLMHPPSMAYLVAAALAVLGDHAWAIRVPGLILLLASGALAWAIAVETGLGAAGAWLAAALFLTNPLALQGALGIDFADGSLLTFSIALFFWFFYRRKPWSAVRRGAWLGACLCLCAWSKLATAFLLACAFSTACLLEEGLERPLTLWLSAAGFGGALFFGSWGLFSAWLARASGLSPWSVASEPFRYLAGGNSGAADPVWKVGPSQWLLYEASFAAYAGPILLSVAALAHRDWLSAVRSRRRLTRGSLIPLFGLACLVLYSAIVGGGRQYNKYFMAPLLCWTMMAAGFLARDGEAAARFWTRAGAAALAAATACFALGVGDYLYTLNFGLRAAQLIGRTRPEILRLAIQAGLCVFLAAAALLKERAGPGLIVIVIGSQLGMDLAQLRGGYDLRQAYGASRREFIETADEIKGWPVDGPVLADRGVVDAAAGRPVVGYGSSSWQDLDSISRFIAEQKPKAVVYGLALNTVGQLRAIGKDERLSALLSSGYSPRQIGSFSVWLRNESRAKP